MARHSLLFDCKLHWCLIKEIRDEMCRSAVDLLVNFEKISAKCKKKIQAILI